MLRPKSHAIRKAREGQGWTQGDLAQRVGTTMRTISALESPALWEGDGPLRSYCRSRIARRIADALGIEDVYELFEYLDWHRGAALTEEEKLFIEEHEEEMSEKEIARELGRTFAIITSYRRRKKEKEDGYEAAGY